MYESRIDLGPLKEKIEVLRGKISEHIVGQDDMVTLILTSILADGHVLLEGPPGLAKTLMAKLMSKILDLDFNRIQFTPDLMPSDILGTSVFNLKTTEFDFKKGPVFAHFILADEINRAPAKTQSALFEVMEEKQVTLDGILYSFEEPFFILATQNPIDMDGTYRLPEAQKDRFLFKIVVDYPSLEEEVSILQGHVSNSPFQRIKNVNPILTRKELLDMRALIPQVRADEKLIRYIAEIVQTTRKSRHLMIGASPRGSIAILNASRAFALLMGRDFITPDDIKEVAIPALVHRVVLTPEREMEGVTEQRVLERLLDQVEVPR